MVLATGPFHEPAWDAPLDPDQVIELLPPRSTMKGMFLQAVAERARSAGVELPAARARYLPFESYPLREHCELLVEIARRVWPDQTLRQGLRRIGRGAPQVVTSTTLGRVTVGSVEGVHEVLRGMAKSFALFAEPGRIEVVEVGPGRALLELRDIAFFIDSHHVGVYEGTLRYAEVANPRVSIRNVSYKDADLLCEWDAA
ncbi:MAG: DUF2378 family protein [Sandaracinaceae bacterium]|nr:DUF2378 family protein [Sandaracinaceae bacterium]